jgi:3-oxoacyl-[acyl-carrier protein] reductase
MSSDQGRVALVSGAAGGLGPACCDALLRRGMIVIVADIDATRANEAATALGANGAPVGSMAIDVTSRESVDRAIEAVVADRGRLDVVVNLAGLMRNQMLHKIVDADFALVMDTHVQGVVNTMRAAIPHMRAAKYGRFVNMSSIAVRGSLAGSSYGAAKGAIEGITRSAAMELAPHGITANCVGPGMIDAGMFLTVPEEYRKESLARVPAGRAGTADEVAACVGFLASWEASYVTGQTLFVCGGATLGF